MTDQQLDEYMAEKVMRWHKDNGWWVSYCNQSIGQGYYAVRKTRMCGIDLWHPTSDMNQTMMCSQQLSHAQLEKVEAFLVQHSSPLMLWLGRPGAARAICLAIVEATKEEKDA